MEKAAVVSAQIVPIGGMDVLSRAEVARLLDATQSGLHALLRRCALAVLTSGNHSDDPRDMAECYPDFEIRVMQQDRGIKLELIRAPAQAFVDGRIIHGIAELLMSVVRDIVYVSTEVQNSGRHDLDSSDGITNAVFEILRHAGILKPQVDPSLVVCWGGHSIGRDEYDYTKKVGYQAGLRGMDICTGCGPGAMKGPMKGATIAHAKQRRGKNRYIGITEPGIIAAESPNPIVNHLVIMPDIEKRLEAFVRMCHGIIVFPGGAGTAEEILYLLGILLDPANASQPLPLVFTGPRESAGYFRQLDRFIELTLGPEAQKRYRIIVDDPPEVAREMQRGFDLVRRSRRRAGDAYNYNWLLRIPPAFQQPFVVTHETMAALELSLDQPVHERAANLRRAFSGIVAGNVKEHGIKLIEENGPFEIHADAAVARPLDELLRGFVAERRMKLVGEYRPSYRIV